SLNGPLPFSVIDAGVACLVSRPSRMIEAPVGSDETLSVAPSSEAGAASGVSGPADGAGAGVAAVVGCVPRPRNRKATMAPTTTTAAAAAGIIHLGVPAGAGAGAAAAREAVLLLRSALPVSAWNLRISVGVAN